ncbi:MAG: hypothetical protein ACJA0T_002938, partial [Colwellia sp.]
LLLVCVGCSPTEFFGVNSIDDCGQIATQAPQFVQSLSFIWGFGTDEFIYLKDIASVSQHS